MSSLQSRVFHSKSHSTQQLDGLFGSWFGTWIQGKDELSRAWAGSSGWCIPCDLVAPAAPVLGVAQAGSEGAASRIQPAAWSRSSLPQLLLLLSAAQMVSPAVKGTFSAFWRSQRESILGVDHKCWSCYSLIICQQAVVGMGDMLKVRLDDIGCLFQPQ